VSLISKNIVKLKEEFVKFYDGNSHVQEILPIKKTEFLPIDDEHLSLLHKFLENNPIYYNSFESKIFGIMCRVFEGDLNHFWINSIKHDTSYAPFYPTWMLSAYALALESKNNGFLELIDIGSGDGRIAFCGEVVGLHSNSIEIDGSLCSLQENILQNMVGNFTIINEDATKIDYKTMKLVKPVFFIGGLPENGELLAESIIKNILKLPKLEKNSCFALTGTHAERTFAKNQSDFGWGVTTKKFNLKIIKMLDLPTYWTMEQSFNTPYIFTNYS
jgi:hypothetical protein